MNEEKNINADVAIIGGGLSGGVLAIALDQAGFSTVLIDAQKPEALLADTYDGRTTAVAFACGRLFRRLGLWGPMAPFASPIREILITDGETATPSRVGGASASYLRFDADALENDSPLGWIIENRVLRRAIMDRLTQSDGIKVLAPARRTRTANDGGSSVTHLADGRQVRASLTVAADGKRSSLAAEAGVRSFSWSYPQKAIIATIKHSRPHNGIAHEFFLPAGPFAILPMTEQRCSIVWTEKKKAVDSYLAMNDQDFLQSLSSRVGNHLGTIELAGPTGSYPLTLSFSHRFFADRLALIGDAARTIHPIAGQGYNLGLKDIAALTDVLCKARSLGQDIGTRDVLGEYDRWRRLDSTGLALGTDFLNRLFSNSFPPIRFARRLGLAAVNEIDPMKVFFMRESGADLGDLPALLQPI